MPMPKKEMTDVEILRAAIKQSGMSNRMYAKVVLVRDERTIRRWLSGKYPIPAAVLELIKS